MVMLIIYILLKNLVRIYMYYKFATCRYILVNITFSNLKRQKLQLLWIVITTKLYKRYNCILYIYIYILIKLLTKIKNDIL